MKRKIKYLTFLCVMTSSILTGQTPFNLNKNKSSKIKFELINNIIIIPVSLNGTKLSFILDTGVSQPILFNFVNLDSLHIRNQTHSYLQGLGNEGAIKAIKSTGNVLRVGDAVSVNQELSLLFDTSINFTPQLGVPVHGILGYNLFKDFVVEINYASKYIRLFKQGYFKFSESRRWETLAINLYKNKPYVDAFIQDNYSERHVKLLIDTGGSDALWLFEDTAKGIGPPDQLFFRDFLGKGLSGSLYGKRSKISTFKLGSFTLNDVNVAYPDSSSLSIARHYKERNGTLAGHILKRFHIFFDYKNERIKIKKNKNFKLPFYYNTSGLVLEQLGFRVVKSPIRSSQDSYGRKNIDGVQTIDLSVRTELVLRPAFGVVELRETSNALAAGVKVGDIIEAINGKRTSEMALEEVNSYFYDKKGESITLAINRDGKLWVFKFALDDVFDKKKGLQNEDYLDN